MSAYLDVLTDEERKLYDEVTSKLGLCGCGQPEAIVEEWISVLEFCAAPYPKNWKFWTLHREHIGHLASDMGLTEHGGSVYGSWMQPAGEAFLGNLKKVLAWMKQD